MPYPRRSTSTGQEATHAMTWPEFVRTSSDPHHEPTWQVATFAYRQRSTTQEAIRERANLSFHTGNEAIFLGYFWGYFFWPSTVVFFFFTKYLLGCAILTFSSIHIVHSSFMDQNAQCLTVWYNIGTGQAHFETKSVYHNLISRSHKTYLVPISYPFCPKTTFGELAHKAAEHFRSRPNSLCLNFPIFGRSDVSTFSGFFAIY